MPSEKTTREMWFDYVVKLNDRNLLKKRAYGITVWAICGLLGILLYRILDKIPQLVKSPELINSFTLSFATVLNLSIGLLIIIFGLIAFLQAPYDIRLKSTIKRFAAPVNAFWGVIINVLLLFFNLRAFLLADQISIPSWPYMAIAIYAALDLLYRIRKRIILFRKFRFMIFELPLLSEPAWLSSKYKTAGGLFILILGGAIFCIPSIGIMHLIQHTDILSHVYILKASIEITLFLYILFFLITQLVEYLQESFLSDLERRIIVDNLSSEEIRESLVNEFLGPTVSEWLYRLKTELSMQYDSTEKVIQDCENKLLELKNIDKSYTHEIKGKKKEIYDTATKAYKKYLDLSKKNFQKLRFLHDQDAFSDSAKDIVTEVLDRMKGQGEEAEQLYKKLKELHNTIQTPDN